MQSRQRAATLKADEEIARLYACAHLACERLKVPLNLPPIEPRPPIPPRVYKRLLTHLDNILPGRGTKANTTPTTVRVRDAALQSSPALGSSIRRAQSPSETIAKAKTISASRSKGLTLVDTPTKATSGGTVRSIKLKSGLPPWVRSAIGFLVNNHNQKKWGRFVLAGVDYAIAPGGRRTKDAWVLGHMPAVVAGIFQVSMDVLSSFGADEEVENVAGADGMKKTVKLMQKARNTISVKGLDEEEFWGSWSEMDIRALKKAKNLVTSQWIDADWYHALEDRARQLYEPENAEPEAGGGENEEKMRIRKPDMMHQERYDFLSREKRAEIKAWRKSVMQRIEALEREKNDAAAAPANAES